MAQAHVIVQDDRDGRWLLGVDSSTGDPLWIHQNIIGSKADQFGLLVYNKWEDAHESANKIGDGAKAVTINY